MRRGGGSIGRHMSEVAATADNLAQARSEIATALGSGDLPGARRLTEDALRRWPRDYGLRMQEADILQQTGETAAAIAHYLRLGREGPEGHWPLLRAVRLLRDSGDIVQAREIFGVEIWSGPAPEETKLRGLAWLITASDDSEPAAAFLERLAAAAAPALAAEVLARLAELRARQGKEDEARSALARIGELDAAPVRARAVEADLMLAEGRASDLLPLARRIAAEEPDRVEHARRLTMALLLARDMQGATDALSAALERWPGDWVLLSRFNILPVPRERIEGLVGLILRQTDLESLPEISRFQIALSLLNLRRTEEALGLLAGIASDGATGAMANPLRRILEMMPTEEWHRNSRLDDDRTAEVQVVRCPGARAALLVFSGATGGHSHLPFAYFDALLSDLPAHVVYVRDTRGLGFLRGLRTFDGSPEGEMAGLRDVIAGLNAERVVALGASIAGHAAARMGAALGADAVALLAAPTTFDTGPIQGARDSPYNRMNRLRRWARTLSSVSPDADLVNLFTGKPATRNFYFYSAGTERGEFNAARLSGIANVVLRALPGSDHAALPLDIIGTPFWDQLLHEDLRLRGLRGRKAASHGRASRRKASRDRGPV